MKSYIGTKIIKATPMTDIEFESEKRAVDSSAHLVALYRSGQNILRDGCAAEGISPRHPRDPKDGYKVMYPDGHISWSPKHVFEEAYREVSAGEKLLIA